MNKEKNSFKTTKTLYDHGIEYDIKKLPKMLQELIEELEEYDKVGDWLNYDLKFEILEVQAKSYLRHNGIDEKDFNILMRKYGWYI